MKLATHTYIPMDSIESQWKVKELENYLLETYTINTNLYEDVSEDKKLIPESIIATHPQASIIMLWDIILTYSMIP